MKFLYTEKDILTLAKACIHLNIQDRSELKWLQSHHMHIQKKYHLKNKQDTDLFLYNRMYGHAPKKPSEVLKLRYWRTGRYTPVNREQCVLLGKALELSSEEYTYLLQNYYDRCLDVYDADSASTEPGHLEKQQYIRQLSDAYLQKVPSERIMHLNIPKGNLRSYLRHLYFTDAFHYIYSTVHPDSDILTRHITSTSYESEFTRQLKLLGEIPRKTMLRHLIIFDLPELTLEKINEQLSLLGYLPLCEEHTLVSGEHLDWLLIRLIRMYEEICTQETPETCLAWFQNACRTLDRFFIDSEKPRLRFMYFKALDLS